MKYPPLQLPPLIAPAAYTDDQMHYIRSSVVDAALRWAAHVVAMSAHRPDEAIRAINEQAEALK